MHILLSDAKEALAIAVDIRGPNYIYSNGNTNCYYSCTAGTGPHIGNPPVVGCGVGAALRVLGMTLEQLRTLDLTGSTSILSTLMPMDWSITSSARGFLAVFQDKQDTGCTWGQALAAANSAFP